MSINRNSIQNIMELNNTKILNTDKLCPAADHCGGCIYQGVDYAEQYRQKDKAVRRLLDKHDIDGSVYLGMEPADAEDAELVFSNANVISELMIKNKTFCGIEISLPGMGYTDLIPKTHLGIKGGLFLTEQVLNGLMSRI